MIRKVGKVCIPIMMGKGMRRQCLIDFCMRIFILLQPALALPVFLNLMLTAYEAGAFERMGWYALAWFVMGGIFLVGRYRFDIVVNGRFYYKMIENIRDVCLGEIYDREREVDAGYDGNPYFAFLRDGAEEFTLLLFRIDRAAAVLAVTAAFFFWCAHISVGMAVLALAGGLASTWAGNFASKRLNKRNEALFRRKAEADGALRNLFYGTETYLTKGRYRQVREGFQRKIAEMNIQSCRNAGKASMRTNSLRILDGIVYAAMVVWCCFILREKSAAVILTMVTAYGILKGYGNELNSIWTRIVEKEYIVDRYEEIMGKREEPEEGTAAVEGHVIEVRGLRYQAGGSEILKGIDMEIGQEEKVALIGPNGAGKSTLLKCILGLLRPSGGEVRRKDALVCSYVPVHPQLFPVSIRENIGYASGSREEDMADFVEAADLARIDSIDLEQELADGEENLSGGEAQRVAAARALAAPGELLIADEPTANLDIQTEKKVIEALLKASRAFIYTTHNPALVGYADKVYIMEKGRIAAGGTPEAVCGLPVYQEWARNVRESRKQEE